MMDTPYSPPRIHRPEDPPRIVHAHRIINALSDDMYDVLDKAGEKEQKENIHNLWIASGAYQNVAHIHQAEPGNPLDPMKIKESAPPHVRYRALKISPKIIQILRENGCEEDARHLLALVALYSDDGQPSD